MEPLSYLVFHPDKWRQRTPATGRAVGPQGPVSWRGLVWADRAPSNCDPLVFWEPWVFSYCHATQMQRRPYGPHLCRGSWLIFSSGDAIDAGKLRVDTVFLVADVRPWRSPKSPPANYDPELHRPDSILWADHLRAGMEGGHPGRFRYTYEAAPFADGNPHYSFLPLDRDGERPTVSLSELPAELTERIRAKVYGKRPVPLNLSDVTTILDAVRKRSSLLLVGPFVRTEATVASPTSGAGCSPC